jgi:hypothetical protein
VRTAVKKHGMNETAIQNTAIEEIDAEVTQALAAYITCKAAEGDCRQGQSA